MQRGLRVITLQGAIEKSPILLSQYWKFELDGTIIISYFGGSNNIFASCNQMPKIICNRAKKEAILEFKIQAAIFPVLI